MSIGPMQGPGRPVHAGSSARLTDPDALRSRTVTLPTPQDTHELGVRLAGVLRRGDLVVLSGPLGAGKTALVQGIGAGLGVDGRVASPTFVIARVHNPGRPGGLSLVHVDAYRLGSLDEVDDLDLDVDAASTVTAVEWGAGMVEQLADSHLLVELDRSADTEERVATLRPNGGDWAERLERLGGRPAAAATRLGSAMFVLALDTSSPAVTAAVVMVGTVGDDSIAAVRTPLAARGHGELLAPSIAECLDDAGIAPRDIGAVVVGTGPGPFTGLRVGMVTGAAFADAVGVPAYGVCSLDAIGAACADVGELLVATDARRHEVYWARYRHGARMGEPAVARPADVPLDGVEAVAGAGGELYAEFWPALSRLPVRYPDPLALVQLAADRIAAAEPAAPLVPLYLRRPDAVVPGAPKTVTARR